MKQFSPDRKLKILDWSLHGLGVAVMLAIALVAGIVVYGPIDRHTAEATQRADRLGQLLKNEARDRAAYEQTAKELATARQQAETLNSRIPDEPREADFLAQVSKLAGEVGLQIRDYRPGSITKKESHSVMRVNLICEGDYASICNFLDQLSELPRHSTVVRLQVKTEGERKEYSVDVSLELYFAAHGRTEADGRKPNDA